MIVTYNDATLSLLSLSHTHALITHIHTLKESMDLIARDTFVRE